MPDAIRVVISPSPNAPVPLTPRHPVVYDTPDEGNGEEGLRGRRTAPEPRA